MPIIFSTPSRHFHSPPRCEPCLPNSLPFPDWFGVCPGDTTWVWLRRGPMKHRAKQASVWSTTRAAEVAVLGPVAGSPRVVEAAWHWVQQAWLCGSGSSARAEFFKFPASAVRLLTPVNRSPSRLNQIKLFCGWSRDTMAFTRWIHLVGFKAFLFGSSF